MPNACTIERRGSPRLPPPDSRVAICLGIGTSIFAELVDVSDGGACLKAPAGFRIDIGERLCLQGRWARGKYRVISKRDSQVHLAAC
jgi:hypothetical protein